MDTKKYVFNGIALFSISFSLLAMAPAALSEPQGLRVQSQTLLARNTFVYNPRTLTWQAINDNGRVIRSGRGSGGRGYCPDIGRSCRTPSGVYSIMSKGGPECRSTRYPLGRGGAPMPYCMFFSRYYAVHGSYEVPNYNASHGCVRVTPNDAAWLSRSFMRVGTKVVIKPY